MGMSLRSRPAVTAMTLSHFRGEFGQGQLEVSEEHWMPAEAVMSMSMWYLDYTEPEPAFIPVPACQTLEIL